MSGDSEKLDDIENGVINLIAENEQLKNDVNELAEALDFMEQEVAMAYFKREPVLIYSGTLEKYHALANKHLTDKKVKV